ncbi:MAG: SUKH-3 domain-containing protein [Micromonosporaceae bacterium]|nr:SUKH-3 domain-containing protein [Micromonosporaceae bacterium]
MDVDKDAWPFVDDGDWQFVPDAEPVRVIPAQLPAEVDGFRIPRPFDGVTEDRRPRISPERGYIRDPQERSRVLGYLRSGAQVVDTLVAGDDLLDPRRRFAVSANEYTDGTWIWGAGIHYYLHWHHVAPEPEFYRHIKAQHYACPPVPAEVVAGAQRASGKATEQYRAAYQAGARELGLLREGDERRFPAEVNQRLLDIGWFAGRDVSDQVDPWLARWAEVLPSFRLQERGYPPYQPLPAATAVLREFGGLVSTDNGPGVTSAKIPFVIYPREGADDLSRFVVDVAQLADRLGKRLFQVGELEDGTLALLVAEDGGVYATGAVELEFGATFDEALRHLLLGYHGEEI